jgi:hypothetical protein
LESIGYHAGGLKTQDQASYTLDKKTKEQERERERERERRQAKGNKLKCESASPHIQVEASHT